MSYETVKGHLLYGLVGTYSLSLQHTLYAMGRRVLQRCAGVDEVQLSLPNEHRVPMDRPLAPPPVVMAW